MHTPRLPASFAAIPVPELTVVKCVRKNLVRQTIHHDISEVVPIFYNRETEGDVFFHRQAHPIFGREEIVQNGRPPLLVYFCITPLTYIDHSREFEIPVVMVYHTTNHTWMTEHGGMYSHVVELAPSHMRQEIYHILGSLYEQLRRNAYEEYAPRRYDPEWDLFDEMIDHPTTPVPRRSRRTRAPPPGGGEPASSASSAASAHPPLTPPAERIALALARDFVQQKETCAITQDTLQHGRIAVTGCLCVFQADALETYKAHQQDATCPTCRSSLVFRVVEVPTPN